MPSNRSIVGRWIAAVLASVGLLAVFYNVIVDNLPKGEVRKIAGYEPWSEKSLEIAEAIPVMDGGRIKPLSSYAGFTMLGIHGARSMKIEGVDGEVKLSPTEWLMDSVFRPQLAAELPTFRVDNSAVLEEVGIKPRGRRDRYSYTDLEPGVAKLVERAQSYENIEKEQREPLQQQTIDLAYNIRSYEALLGYLSFARVGVEMPGSGREGEPDQRANVSTLMATADMLRSQLQQAHQSGEPVNPRLQALLEQVIDLSNFAKFGLFIIPPTDPETEQWLSAGDAIMAVMTGGAGDPEVFREDILALEAVGRHAGDDAGFREALAAVRDRFVERAKERGEYDHVPLEVSYYRANWFLNALVFFLIGTLTALPMWMTGRGKAGAVLAGSTWLFTVAGLALCVVALVQRSVIMERPPVANLYDTIIFIGSTGVLLALLIELMTRRRFALGLAPILGTLLIVLARRYELGDAKDHMDPLVAVLDSNFWLTVHVITITLGYSAGLLAAALSCGYIIIRGLGLDEGNRDLRRSLTGAVYGVICLTLFLSLVGTVLGGIWANYSWGRFWGWDPKENGALMIVLWTLVILHARLGGYIREWGLHLASVFTACVVAFSWWHVNFLGVGLHNYGFTAGKGTIWVFYGVMGLFLILGFIARALDGTPKRVPPPLPEPSAT